MNGSRDSWIKQRSPPDPSGLPQLGARFYWPQIGRFIQQDPLGDDINWYAYVAANPMTRIDPVGEFCVHIFGQCFGTTCTGDPECPPKQPGGPGPSPPSANPPTGCPPGGPRGGPAGGSAGAQSCPTLPCKGGTCCDYVLKEMPALEAYPGAAACYDECIRNHDYAFRYGNQTKPYGSGASPGQIVSEMLLCLAKALGRRVMAGYAGHPVLGFYLDQLCN